MQRPDCGEPEIVFFTPATELSNSLHVSRARVLVADRGGEEFEEVFGCLVALGGDNRRYRELRCGDGWKDFEVGAGHRMRSGRFAIPPDHTGTPGIGQP